ncbi:MAG: putative sulfate exporter family transporter [Elusimicrobia bacterium]|nr:putative sulfate exporter family transporter [Elusimicrobiota bacterium]
MTESKDPSRGRWAAAVFLAGGAASLLPGVSPAVALTGGALAGLTLGNPFGARTKALSKSLLAWSIVGLGAGANLLVVARTGLHGIGVTAVSISLTLALGILLGRRFGVAPRAALLVSVGTAICGGSAIAAPAPAIGAEDEEVTVALAVVFLLNAAALFLFPAVGRALHLSQTRFGTWSALAIHDTSSVVAAGLAYGAKALEVGTTLKLTRALWIVPVTALLGAQARKKGTGGGAGIKPPWFIAGFVAAAAVATLVPAVRPEAAWVDWAAKRTLVLTLFLIGSQLTPAALRRAGGRAFGHALALWAVVACATLAAVVLV